MSEGQKAQGLASTPKVVEAYRDYIPPQWVLPTIHDLLESVPPRYLIGLQTIVLTNQAAQPRKRKQQRVWSRNRKIKLISARGYYSGASQSARASITLHIDNILKNVSRREQKFSFVRYFPLGRVLYHEIWHHIHAEHKPAYEGKENVAEDWSEKPLRRFYRTHYWYLMLLVEPVAYLSRLGRSITTRLRQTFSAE